MAKKHVYTYESGMAADGEAAKGYNFIRALRMFAHAGGKSPTSLHTSNDDVHASRNERGNVERLSYSLVDMRRHNSCV